MAKTEGSLIVWASLLAALLVSLCAGQSLPPTPTGVTVQYLGTLVIEFKWDATVGDFDSYLLVYHDATTAEVGNDVIPKTETSFRYLVNDPNVVAYSFYTLRGTTRSIGSNITPLPAIVYSIQLPDTVVGPKQPTSISISWADAPDPGDNIGQYKVSLEQPPGTAIDQATVDAVAGASVTFDGLDVAEEYRLRVDVVLLDGIPVEANVIVDTWTVPYAPSNGILRLTGNSTGTLTWTEAQPPFDYYELVLTPQGGQPRTMQFPPGTSRVKLDSLKTGTVYGFTLRTVVDTPGRRFLSDSAEITLLDIMTTAQPLTTSRGTESRGSLASLLLVAVGLCAMALG